MRLLLASASPRRAELLSAAGFEFDIAPVGIDESVRQGEGSRAYVSRLARAKAAAAAGGAPSRPVLAADTAVVIDGRILGKPQDDREAAAMVGLLSGKTHEVLTGVAIRFGERFAEGLESTAVTLVELSPEEIEWYVATGEPHGKAGGYGVQGLASRFVNRIEGSYSNVVGLPIAMVYELLKQVQAL